MALTRKEEERALNSDELSLVSQTRHPDLQNLSDSELHSLAKLLRERRSKAQTLARQKRREIRGKADPRGQSAVTADGGSKLKLSVLSTATSRLNAEIERRNQMTNRHSLVENAAHALELKQHADKHKIPFNTRTANEGIRNIPDRAIRSLINPAERGRLKKASNVAQAKKDTRQDAAS